MTRNDLGHEARKQLERAYEKALRHAVWYNSRWDRVEKIARKLRALRAAEETAGNEAA